MPCAAQPIQTGQTQDAKCDASGASPIAVASCKMPISECHRQSDCDHPHDRPPGDKPGQLVPRPDFRAGCLGPRLVDGEIDDPPVQSSGCYADPTGWI